MKMIIILSLSVVILSGCKRDADPQPAPVPPDQLLTNLDMEAGSENQPNSWWLGPFATDTTTLWTTEESSSATHSLELKATVSDTTVLYWGQTYQGVTPVGKDVTLTIKVKGKNIAGDGAAIALRGDDTSIPVTYTTVIDFNTTEHTTKIDGTFDWTSYSIKLTNVSPYTKSISVFLILLPHTTGKVYFDDAQLTIE
jgi:hypothetical protein